MGERELWAAVLGVTLRDAVMPVGGYTTEQEKHISQGMLRRNDKHFQEICMFAGRDPDVVREKYFSGKIREDAFGAWHNPAEPDALRGSNYAAAVLRELSKAEMNVSEVARSLRVSLSTAKEVLYSLRTVGKVTFRVDKNRTRIWRAIRGEVAE